MKIGIIGAGSIGASLTRRLSGVSNHVTVANSRGPETLRDLAVETGSTAVSLADVAADVDVLIVAIPTAAVVSFEPSVLDALPDHAVVVDVTNYVPHLRDPFIDELDKGAVESQWTQARLGRPVVKAFNNIVADHLHNGGRPVGDPHRIALPVAGDDPTAKATVCELVGQLGFDTVDAGPIDQSWRQQPGTPVYATDLDADGVRQALAAAQPEQTVQWRNALAAHQPG